MTSILKVTNSFMQFEFFCREESQQKILLDILLKYGEMDIASLAGALNISENTLQDVFNDKKFLVGEEANDLGQLFLRFLGDRFFRNFSIVRNFVS